MNKMESHSGSIMALVGAAAVLLMLSVPVHATQAQTDARIASSARESYVFRTYLQNDAIKIESKDGVVTLTGSVAESSHKALAQETVADLPGVKRVDNQLEIKGPSATANSDAWIGDKVKMSLLFHRNVSGLDTEVQVKDGIVTLRGNAETQAQKELTREYAKDIDGVKEVKNEMSVSGSTKELSISKPHQKTQTTGEKIDDASITAQVKLTLLYHRSTSAIHTAVKTHNGVVTLSGKAANAAEADLAAKLAKDIHGVKTVKNQMTTK